MKGFAESVMIPGLECGRVDTEDPPERGVLVSLISGVVGPLHATYHVAWPAVENEW